MKFEYDDNAERGKCVAYVTELGNVMIKSPKRTGEEVVILCGDGSLGSGLKWDVQNATKKFYPGDKITITF